MKFLLIFILVIFSAYTAWIAWEFGYTSVFVVSLKEHQTIQVLIDLFIMGGIVLAIMITDNRRNGRSFRKVAPYIILTAIAGAIGPLLYFIVNTDLLISENKKNSLNSILFLSKAN